MGSNYVETAQLAATVFAALGLLLTAAQISRSTRQTRIERVDRCRREFFSDVDMKEVYYQIEYGEFSYSEGFHGSEDEKKVDKLLSMFDSLATQVDMGLLKLGDLDLIAYEYIITYQNKDIVAYLAFLDDWFQTKEIRRSPFAAFRKIGQRLEKRGFARGI